MSQSELVRPMKRYAGGRSRDSEKGSSFPAEIGRILAGETAGVSREVPRTRQPQEVRA
jgi:hypothetical protein